jgi:Nif-specific regulatory protein
VFDVPAWSSSSALPVSPAADPAPPELAPGVAAGAADDVRLPGNLALDEAERRYARAILERCDGNQSAAARLLGISRNKLARLLKA